MALCFAAPATFANPTGPTVVNGAASFATSGAKLTVTNTPGAIINWQQFSIQQNEVTRFIQQNAASAVLNRVTSGIPSAILGTLSSNGRVYLINASGITIGRGAMIDVAGFAASTLNLSDADFLAGRNVFRGAGTEGAVQNAGTIRTAEGGHVYLVAPKVQNQADAVITSPKGEVVIAAGRTVELVNAASPDVRVEFTAAGEAMNAGTIVAASGQVGIYGTLVKNSGLVSASRAVTGAGGKIVFKAAEEVLLQAGSKVEATGDTGGTIQVLGNRVGVLEGASLDASGDTAGGTVLVGGDFQGKNADVPNAWRTYFGAGASIKADALERGDGGKVIVWADDITRAYGEISARGGAAGGNGGLVEVSGKNQLDFDARVDVGAAAGRAGTLLLDPTNIVISNNTGTQNAQVADGAILFGDAGTTFTITDEALEAQLGNIVLQATQDITVSAGLSGGLDLANQGAGERVVLQAGRDITIGSPITTAGAAIILEADSVHSTSGGANGTGTLTINAGITSNGGKITLIGGGNSILGGGGIALSENQTIDAGAGGIDVALSGNADLGVGSLGLLTQIIGNPMDELHTTGALRIGTATTAGSDGLGTGAQTLLADSVTNIYPGSAIDLSPASGSTFEIYAGAGGIVLDQPLTTFQDTVISTTGTLTINDPINTTNNALQLVAANVVTGANGSINTGTGACTGGGCPVSTIFWDGGGDGTSWLDANNWSTDALPTIADIVDIGAGVSTVVVASGAAEARSVIANRGFTIDATGSLQIAEASQFADLLTLAGGSLLGTGSAAVTGPSGSFAWSGGSMAGAGSFQLVSGRSGALSNSLVLDRNFLNEGLLTLTNATITGSGAFANAGTLTAAAGSTNSIANAFQNISNTIAGTIQVNGALTLGNFPLNEGTISVAAAGSFSVGTLDNIGTVTVDGSASIGTLTLTSGTVGGTGDLTVGTDFNANGGALGTTFSDLSIAKSGAFAVDSFTAVDSISLTAGGALTDANGASVNLTAGAVSLSAAGGISLDTATGALTTNNVTSGNTSIRNTGALTVNGMSSTGTVTLANSAGITLAGDITAAGSGDAIVLSGTTFDNSADRALNPGTGRFLVWSGDPANDDRGSLGYGFKQYNASFGSSTVLGTGNGFLYTVAPTITAGLTGTVSKDYDAGTSATLAGANYTVSGAIDGDTVTLNNPASGSYDTKDVGTLKTVSVSGIAIGSATDGAATVYGYQLASTSASGNVGEIDAVPLTVTASNASKSYGQTTTFAGTEFTSSGLVGGETIGSVTLNSAGAAATAGVAGSPYAITPSAATGGTFSAGNYTITYSNGSLTISSAALTVTANNASKNYGQTVTFAGTEFTSSGLQNGETIGSVTLASPGAAATANVAGSPYAITASAATGGTFTTGNYTITYADGALTISPAALTVTASNASKNYGQTVSFAGTEFTSSGLQNGETIGSVTLASTGAAATASVAGSPYAITASAATGGTFTSGNYTITYADGALTIGPAALTVTANNASKNYGQTVSFAGTEFTSSGLQNGETIGSVTLASTGAAATANVAGSPYAITASNAAGGTFTSGNYTITYNDGSLTISPASLTVTANNASKNYGQTVTFAGTEFTSSGLQNGETIGSVTLASLGAAATANVAGSPYAITASAATGGTFTSGNYTITYADGALTISPAALTVTASNAAKNYGQTVNFAGTEFTSSGLQNGETIGSVTLASTGAAATANVAGSPYAITASAATGGTFTSGNYTITYADGALTISPASLTVTASSAAKNYGQTVNFAGTEFTSSGLQNGESIGSVTLASSGAAATANVAGSPYAITASAATGGTFASGNYTITYADGALTISPAALTVTANNASKNYGQTVSFAGTEFTSSGLQNGETIGSVTLASTGAAATANVAGSPYAITASAASGGTFASGNYTITYNDGSLTISPAALTVTATNASKNYGQTVNFAGTEFTASGLQNGESIGSVTLASAGAAATANVAGSPYAITASAATGGTFTSGNYTITYADGALTISPAALTVTASNASKNYGQTVTFAGTEFTSSGLQNGETIGSVTLASLGAAATANVAGSPYAITASNATGGTFASGNYTITYADGALTISPAVLTVTASNAAKNYGQTVTFAGTEFTSSGLQNGESIGSVTLASTGAAPTANVAGSPYAITASNATGGTFAAGNYTITYADGALTISPAALAVTANNAAKTYGQTVNFAGTEFTATGLQNGESIGTLLLASAGTAAGASVAGGPYAITASNAAGGTFSAGNYTITYNDGALTINPALLTYLADPASRNFGDPNPALSGQVTGFVNGETLGTATTGSATWTSLADAASPVGSYAIEGGGLTALNGNYTFVQAPGNATALSVAGLPPVPPSSLTPPPAPPPPEGSIAPQTPIDTTLLNLNTGESVFVAPNSIPDPGIYLSQDANSVVVVGQSDLGAQLNVASTLLFPVVSYEAGTYVNSETGFLYAVEEGAILDPGVYYNREQQTVLVVSANDDGNVTVSSANISEAVQTVATGAGGRRVVSVACR